MAESSSVGGMWIPSKVLSVPLSASVSLNLELAISRELLDDDVGEFISTPLTLALSPTTEASGVGNCRTL